MSRIRHHKPEHAVEVEAPLEDAFVAPIEDDPTPAVEPVTTKVVVPRAAVAVTLPTPMGFTRVRVTGGGFCYLGKVHEDGAVIDAPDADCLNHPTLLVPVE